VGADRVGDRVAGTAVGKARQPKAKHSTSWVGVLFPLTALERVSEWLSYHLMGIFMRDIAGPVCANLVDCVICRYNFAEFMQLVDVIPSVQLHP